MLLPQLVKPSMPIYITNWTKIKKSLTITEVKNIEQSTLLKSTPSMTSWELKNWETEPQSSTKNLRKKKRDSTNYIMPIKWVHVDMISDMREELLTTKCMLSPKNGTMLSMELPTPSPSLELPSSPSSESLLLPLTCSPRRVMLLNHPLLLLWSTKSDFIR